ncbi:major capsid protein [Aeromonas caviae]|nr:major capsid protein [Aeromonas caviae]
MELTEITTAITGAVTQVTTIGMACLSVYVTIKTFTWVRGAFK